jgi:hypothetical protein
MRKRIYWLLPDLPSARAVMSDLLLARIENSHIHFMAREGVELSGLHEANLLQASDFVRSAQMGLALGAALGAAAGAAITLSSLGEMVSKPGLVAALTALGAAFGAWSASMIGASMPSQRLRRFDAALARGEILLMADVPARRVDEIEAMLHAQHGEGHDEGLEPNVPAFP